MRIIFVTPDYPDETSLSGSGVGTFAYNISHELAEYGCDSVILVCGQPDKQNEKIGEHITVRYTNRIGNIHYYVSRLLVIGKLQFLVNFIKQWEISKTVLDELKLLLKETGTKETLLEIPEGHGNFLLWKKNRLVPYIVVIHGSLSLHAHAIGKNKSFFNWLMVILYKVIMRGASAVICPSRFVATFYENKLFMQKVFYCPNPVSLPKLMALDNIQQSKTVVLSVSALSWSKGIDTLKEAIVGIARVRKDISFVIVGSDGDIKKRDLDVFFKINHLSGIVQVIGYVHWSKVGYWYKSCDIFVSASRFETFGQTIAEAMLSGKPVIATSAGAIPELLDNGQRGILVKPGDSAAFAQEIIRLADDRELCKELGLKGMQKISAENSPAHAIQERLALYRNILDESKNKFAQ